MLGDDLARAARALRRRPGFTALAALTLAVGIGGATATFSVADAVVLRPLPYLHADHVVAIWGTRQGSETPFEEISYPAFVHWRDHSQGFEVVAAMSSVNGGVVLSGLREPKALAARWVTSGFFSVLGVRPALGRALLPEDDAVGAAPVVVLSHSLWRELFDSDPNIVGRMTTLDARPFRIVGVMPRSFAYPTGAQLWATPSAWPWGQGAMGNNELQWMVGLGRLKEGTGIRAAETELTALWRSHNRPPEGNLSPGDRQIAEGYLGRYSVVLTPLADTVFGSTRAAFLALMGAVGLVLLIACANVAGLLVVKTTDRGSELAVRHALGATQARLARALLAESLLLAALGGVLGVLLAIVVTPVLVAVSPQDLPRLHEATLNLRALGLAVGASTLTVVLCGIAPILIARGIPLEEKLREGSRRLASGRSRFRAAIVVGEVGLALLLIVGAGLLGRTFVNLSRAPLGFEPQPVLAVSIPLSETRYPEITQVRAFYGDLLERVAALPGVEAAAGVTNPPLVGLVGYDSWFAIEGQSDAQALKNPQVNLEGVTADYFRTMGIPLRRGRVFSDRDADGQPGVIVLGESLARLCWPGQDPLGKRLKIALPGTPYDGAWLPVVGIVADGRYREIQRTRLDFYMSALQMNNRLSSLVVRSKSDPLALAPGVREAVRSLDKDLPVEGVAMARLVSEALGGPLFAARLFGVFAGIALFLAALGLYGLLAYSVSRRTREIGLRIALGASRVDVQKMILGEGMALTATGVVLGLAGSLAVARLVSGLLYGVRPADPLTLAVAPLVMGLVSLTASLLPVRRATRVDPAVALRSE